MAGGTAQGTGTHTDFLKEENAVLKTHIHTLAKHVSRVPMQTEGAVERAVMRAGKAADHTRAELNIKTHGVIPEETCALVHDLLGKGVPVSQVNAAMSAVASAAGCTISGSLSERSVGRVALKGYVASKMQLVEEISKADAHELPAKITGANTDHAKDQKKFARLCEAWKITSECELCGERALALMTKEELIPILWEESSRTIETAGGIAVWDRLPECEQDRRHWETLAAVITRLGEASYDALTDEEKRRARLFVWGGCCMHKDLNAVKGGNAGLRDFWKVSGLTGPILLMNRDNDAAASTGGPAAKARAEVESDGGGIKTTKLAGAKFRHKYDKKGQQDSYRIFFEASSAVGTTVRFPDTSNTRYQSHCLAAEELLVHLPLYIEFLEAIRDKKDNHQFNHMEANLYKALHDIPTLTGLSVLALYSQAICHPYLWQIHGPNQDSSNLLELGPLHDHIKTHCQHVIEEPALLLDPSADYQEGSLDGKLWERPQVIYTVKRLMPDLSHLRPALIAFFKGALST
ncbi:hypothetical protein WOLCODRAFT_16798 [Wolfiporia cocos MD-104 SS10]|uniref:Uncharacterized protein n=1 Tax=Wolfiporia cocos (strain MD-104) TaxID=742152 RepID=A0A2H3JQ74_WOLCO|nr:hypothetical protein WOLCODRAFT_16798 [Wolfiporia cocos MD-104 SS10]